MIIGLTGQTGSGKSTVGDMLRKEGFFVCDADLIAREVVSSSPTVLEKLIEAFGEDIVKDGVLDRKKLASRAFSSEEKTKLLNDITLPAILERIFSVSEEAVSQGYKHAFLDAPTLFESGGDKRCDLIVAVTAPSEERLERILKRDFLTEEQAKERMNAQKDDGFYTERADFVIRNANSCDLEGQVKELVRIISQKGAQGSCV